MFKEDNRLTRVYVIALVLFAVGFGFYLRNRNLLNEVEEFAARNWVLAWLLMLSLYVFRAFVAFLCFLCYERQNFSRKDSSVSG